MDAASMLNMARRRAQLSQRELARRSGIPQATVSRIEGGVVSPTFDTLDPLIRACRMRLSVGEAPGEGVDRSLIRDALRRAPRERLRYAIEVARRLDRMRRTAREVPA